MAFPSKKKPLSKTDNDTDPGSPSSELAWRWDQKIDSQPDNCAPVIEAVLLQLEKFHWDNRDTFGIHMAMEEAVMNAIKHGNKCAADKRVHIEIKIDERKFYSRITDEGDGFILADVPDPTLEENLEKTCGRGVMLIKNFVDNVTYNDKGNSVELEKEKS